MKEAAGEANLTVVAIILIGVIAAVVTPIVNSTMTTTAKKTCCQNAGGVWKGNACKTVSSTGAIGSDMAVTSYWDSKNNTCADGSTPAPAGS